MWIVRHRVDADYNAPSKARRFVNRCVRGRAGADRIDDVLLLTSELVTNAIDHGAAPVTLDVSCEDTTVNIEVHDAGFGQPAAGRLERPAPESVSGLGVVAALADEWGVTRDASGKTVWCRIDGERAGGLSNPNSC